MSSSPRMIGLTPTRGAVSVRANGEFCQIGKVCQARFVIDGQLEEHELTAALQTVAGRQEFLRAYFPENENGGSQLTIAPSVKVSCQGYDCRGLDSETAESWIQSLLETERAQQMPTHRAPLLRCVVIHTAPDRHELMFTFHAALMSVSESGKLVAEIMEIKTHADAVQNGNGHQRPALPLQIVDVTEMATRWREISEAPDTPADVAVRGNVVFFPEVNAPSKPGIVLKEKTKEIVPPLKRAEAEEAVDSTELELTRLWEAVLKVQPVGRRDDFFKLGGHSLMAAKLLTRIHKSFGKELSLASLLEAPTIELQADLIRGTKKEKDKKPKEGATAVLPFFLLGGYATFHSLVESLRPETTLHSIGLQPALIEDLEDPKSLACMAEAFIRRIRERQPMGPYALGGWCSHGLLALEAARQLRALGESVALVVMMETPNPVAQQAYAPWKRSVARMQLKWNLVEFEMAYLRRVSRTQAWNHVAERVNKKASKVWASLQGHFTGTKRDKEQENPLKKDPFEVLYAAGEAYRPAPYDGRVVLFRSKKKSFGFAGDLRMGWDNLLGDQFEIREIPGNHFSIYLDPNAQVLAKEIGDCLREAQALGGADKRALR